MSSARTYNALRLYLLGGALLALALVLFSSHALSIPVHVQDADITAQLTPPQPSTAQPQGEVVAGKPVRVTVPSRTIDLPVAEGWFNQDDGSWTLSNYQAHFAVNSSLANNRAGNTFIYGHDIPQVFNRLHGLQPGDIAEVVTDNNYAFTYKFRNAIDVPPHNTSTFTYTGPSILTLQTCSGVWSETRRLMIFDFIKVQKL